MTTLINIKTITIAGLVTITSFSCISLFTQPLAAEIYKQIQPDGTVTFTDQPSEGQAREKVKLSPPAIIPSVNPSAILDNAEPKSKAINYSITIQSPVSGTTYRNDNASAIPFTYTLNPSLKQSHTLKASINGKPLDVKAAQLPPQYRGEHTLVLKIVDKSGKELAKTSTTFFVHQHSAILNTPEQNSG